MHDHNILSTCQIFNFTFSTHSHPPLLPLHSSLPPSHPHTPRRDKDKLSVLPLSTTPDIDTDILDLDDQFTPSALYAGTGGKPPLTFSLSDSKPPRKRYVCRGVRDIYSERPYVM